MNTSHKVKPYPYDGGEEKLNVWYDVSKVNPHVAVCHMVVTDTLRIFAERYRDGECYKYRVVWRLLAGGGQQSEEVDVQSMDDAMSIAPIIARLA